MAKMANGGIGHGGVMKSVINSVAGESVGENGAQWHEMAWHHGGVNNGINIGNGISSAACAQAS
jgi:hypothetical protein